MSDLQREIEEARGAMEAAAAMRSQAEEAELAASRRLANAEQQLRARTFSANATVMVNHYSNFSMSSPDTKPILAQGERVHARQDGEARWEDWMITKEDGTQVPLNWEMVSTRSAYGRRAGLMILVVLDEAASP